MTKSEEMEALKDRVCLGNQKLIDAWNQICKLDTDSQRWKDELARWHEANEKLSFLCIQLEVLGYRDCLYILDGKKTKKCGDMGAIGCRVCPCSPDKAYWEKELDFKP